MLLSRIVHSVRRSANTVRWSNGKLIPFGPNTCCRLIIGKTIIYPFTDYQIARSLYSERFLGISNYEKQRLSLSDHQFDSQRLKYDIEMGDTDSLLLSTKRAMFVVDKSMDHLMLIRDSLSRIQRNPNVANRFVLGPVAMRMFHYLNMPDMALQVGSCTY